jgi:hypothetical protein
VTDLQTPAVPAPAAPSTPDPADPPAVLASLVAAGLVNHEAIGDPARLDGEAAVLRALCARVAAPVYRIAPFHYAFAATPADLGGALGALPETDWAGAFEAELAAEFGPEAVWIGATDLLGGAAAALPEAPVLMLRAWGAAAEGALRAAGPELHAVINARFAAGAAAVLAAESVAKVEPALAGFETRLAALETALDSALAEGLGRLGTALAEGLGDLGRRLEAHAAAETAARHAHEELVGLALAEFLARLEIGPAPRRPAVVGVPGA